MDWTRLSFLRPTRIVDGLRRRAREGGGLRAAAIHGLREAGALIDHALAGPMVVRINPMGVVCNHACPMCWLQHLDPGDFKERKRLDREQGMQLADYARLFGSMPPGLETVEVVGGGEPLAHPQCLDVMAEVKRHGWRGSLVTNGSLLRESAARRLVEIGWDYARVSVHAGDAETYRLIHGVDHYDLVRENLKAYGRLRGQAGGPWRGHLCIFNVLQHENIGHVGRLFAFAEEVGADSLIFEKIIPYDASKVLSAEEIRRAREAVVACARASAIPCNLEDLEPALEHEAQATDEGKPWVPGKRCSVGFDQAFVTAEGNVLPCCFSDEVMGNLRERSFAEIWRGERYREFRRRLNSGRFAHYCIGNRCAMKGVVHR
jgi:radical SAM protein with 4Fe4S-binding SPASM domain